MSTFLIQNNFKLGEISPILYAREDSINFNGAKRLRNVLVLPQGGVRRRFGTRYIANLTSLQSNFALYKPFFFDHQDGNKYLLLFTPLAITIFHNDAIVATVVTTYTSTDIPLLDVAQSNDLVFIVCRGHVPAILKRTVAHATWALTAATFTHLPAYDFKKNYDTFTFTVFASGTSTVLPASANLVGQYVRIECSAAVFTNTDYEQALWLGGGATIRMTNYVSTTAIIGYIIKVFDDKCIILDSTLSDAARVLPGQSVVLTEKMFSAARGWPEKVAFFQNRVWFARTASLPGLVVGSSYNGFSSNGNTGQLNFDDSRVLETSAISTVLYGQRSTIVNQITSFKSLLIFTTSGVYTTALDLYEPLTPLNINYVNLQSADITNDMKPQILDNNVVFFDKGGSRVKTLLVNDDGKNYYASTLNILAPHVVNQPYSSAVYNASSTIDGSYLFVTNLSTDIATRGTLATYNLIPEQGITAWTLHETGTDKALEGFRHVVSDGETVYFIVERLINGNSVIYLEKLDFNYLTDCTIPFTQSSSNTITGLGALEGMEVDVIAGTDAFDQGFMGEHTVAVGSVLLNSPVTSGYVGLRFTPEVVPMPLFIPTQIGNNIFHPKLIKCLYVDFFESLSITVNDTKLRYFNLNEEMMDVSLVPQTNYEQVTPMAGWDPRAEIIISQDAPNPFTLIGIGMTIEA